MTTSERKDPAGCKICEYWGADIQINGCGCHVHARCLPLAFLQPTSNSDSERQPCPCCRGPVSGLYLKPLSFLDLEDSVRLRKAEALKKNTNQPYDDEDAETEARYLVFSQGRNTVSSTLSDTDNARTGRWTDDEVAFVDHLVMAFDKGELPLAEGVKLSNFLGDILLCKASRLTKKMKNAKLSTRSFEVTKTPTSETSKEDSQVFSALQDRFIASIPTKVAQLELKFNLVKQWRTYFSNMCIQMGYQQLDAHDWICSVEEIERLASKTEEQMRIVRRKRMGLGGSTTTTNYQRPLKQARTESSPLELASTTISASSSESAFGANVSVLGSPEHTSSAHDQTFSDELDTAFMSLYDQEGDNLPAYSHDDEKGAPLIAPTEAPPTDNFLEALSRFMETGKLPFQHADVWVPSFTHGSGDQVQLLHAGHATRRDQDGVAIGIMNNFGEFSKSFVFSPNHGLPGRVYTAGQAQWEFELSNPNVFPRHKGAKAYGIKTATGIPISAPGVGRMVVVFYSSMKVPENPFLVAECANKLASYAPTPKWKLVIEMGNPRPSSPVHEHPSITEVSTSKQVDGPLVVEEMVSLLGNELAAASNSNPSPQDLSRHMMGMRLLLLRSPSSRTREENDLVGILEGSFKAYAKDNKRSRSELARLLVTEYMCLTSTTSDSDSCSMPNSSPQLLHQEQPKLPPMLKEEPVAVPTKVYSSTQLAIPRATLPPMTFGRTSSSSAMSRPPTRLPSVLSMSSMRSRGRVVSLTGGTSGCYPSDQGFIDQAPSF